MLTSADFASIQARIDYHLRKYKRGTLKIARKDLAQNCWLEVLKMLPRYDPAAGTKLSTFVNARVAGSIIDMLRVQDRWQTRHRQYVELKGLRGSQESRELHENYY